MGMSHLKPVRTKNLSLPEYGLTPLDWDEVEAAVAAAEPGPNRSWFLTTLNRDGSPHTTGFGHVWLDGAIYLTTGPEVLKTRNLVADPRCTVAAPIDGYDVTFDGEAHRVPDPAVVERIAAERDFAALPVLADALEDAGCADAAILEHCRQREPHFRGCWVRDSFLAKVQVGCAVLPPVA